MFRTQSDTKTTPPSLLNDDGSASIATALLMSHHAFRRDIARFGVALRSLAGGDAAKVAALQGEWAYYRAALHGHHQVEDSSMFPGLRGQNADLGPVFDQLSADHRQIDPLLDAGDRAFAALGIAPTMAASVVEDLSALLHRHLTLEEANVTGFLRGAKAFPPLEEAQAGMYAEGFAWSSEGVAPEVLAKLDALLPPAVTARLGEARAAFAARSARVWGLAPAGASRTSVPDWLGRVVPLR